MTINHEAVPNVWTAQDEDFFRVVSTLLAPGFLQGASALLASYDADADAAYDARTPTTTRSPVAAPVPPQRATAPDWPLAA